MTGARCFALALLIAAVPLAAQRNGSPELKRPTLAAGADVNSPHAYYELGVRLLEHEPQRAAEAFRWAFRLDPTWADPLYARRVALLMSKPGMLAQYMVDSRRFRESAEMLALDSLLFRAQMLNPFLHRKHDKQMLTQYILKESERDIRGRGEEVDRAFLRFAIENYLRSAGPGMNAWVAYSEGRFPAALAHYSAALRGAREKSGIHAQRGRVFFFTGSYDSAQSAFEQALADWRKQDDKKLVLLYEPKALLEHSIGMLREEEGDIAGAREAYGRALQEDLAYYPAHQRLAVLALAAGDTVTALSEMDLAVQIKGDEPALRMSYGHILALAKRYDQAVEHLRKAIELEPLYATPYVVLAAVVEARGKPAEALGHYRTFLEHASRSDPNLERAQRRLADLSAGAAEPTRAP